MGQFRSRSSYTLPKLVLNTIRTLTLPNTSAVPQTFTPSSFGLSEAWNRFSHACLLDNT